MPRPILVMLAGPNGAGKSTFYEAHLKSLEVPFLNADILARETRAEAYEAAKTIAAIRDQMIWRGESFITETVLSDPVGEKVGVLAGAVSEGFDVTLIYIGISSPDLSQRRVQSRVTAGGHDVPAEKLEGRYRRSLENLARAIESLPKVLIYDNSSFQAPYRMLAEFYDGEVAWMTADAIPYWAREFLEQR